VTCRRLALLTVALSGLMVRADDKKPAPPKADGPPVSADPRLVVELFAAAPDVVQPIATDFDSKGRLLVVESHTHFRPAKYDGPKADRIRILEDTDGDGKADKFTTFFEGTTHTMDLAVHFDGSVYVATRNEVIRLRDTDGDGKADEKKRIAFLETAGNYPHNGLAGLMFGSKGDLYFGIGENLGAPYKLIGSDSKSLAGGGEGGNVFHCTADGKELRRVATGFWNPFGACRDIFGRMWVVDNDPDASPPCRLLYLVEGGDYGYQFRYGRSGRHPFQAWNGELPGTLPMAAGTGESPCEVISYESDGLPAEYRGHLLVPAWADHRIERYVPRVQGAGMAADRKPFIQGGKEFRPSGLTVAPDGSLFVTDWVSRSYELHGKGAVWHVRWKDAPYSAAKPRLSGSDPTNAILVSDRPTRDAAARRLASDDAGRAYLRDRLASADARIRASVLTALLDVGDPKIDLAEVAAKDPEPAIRAMAVRSLVARGAALPALPPDLETPAVRVEMIAGMKLKVVPPLLDLLIDPDPYVRHAVVLRLAADPDTLARVSHRSFGDPKRRIGVLLAHRASGAPTASRVVPDFLADADPDARLMAVKWVADDRLTEYRPQIVEAMKAPDLDPRTYLALATALARLDDKPVSEDGLVNHFVDRLIAPDTSLAAKRMALRVVPASHQKLKTAVLLDLLKDKDPGFRIEVLRALTEKADPAAAGPVVRRLVADKGQPAAVRAHAVVTIAAVAPPDVDYFIDLAAENDSAVRDEALRGMRGAKFTPQQAARLDEMVKPETDFLIGRLRDRRFMTGRPHDTSINLWLNRLDGPADAEAGRRIFENPKVATCARCHKVDGRGSNIGPDLSLVGRTDRKWIVESILQPAAVVAPHYQPWQVSTLDGKQRIGLLVHTNLDESFYVDEKGNRFRVEAKELDEAVPAKGSVMPNGLVDTLTDQEIRDLVAFLMSRK
jgi:putative membrane-bound dehydrogenase-like protein